MGKIRVLDRLVANQIAAGEVIERPASVIKEALENALDAGADRITIEVNNGGRDLRINDNGSGMEPDDLPLAFERFATSKIRNIEDLSHLQTMGFRGEALASIASVAKVECTSRTLQNKMGSRLVIEGGELISISNVACNPGTTLIVRDLFYNTPARLKFLKSASTEFSHIYQVVHHEALTYPGKGIKLIHNGKEVIDTTPASNQQEVATLLLGREIGKALVPLEYSFPEGRVAGLISIPTLTKPTKNFQYFFLNHRWIKSPLLQKALMEGYEAALPKDQYPVAIIDLELDPVYFDVNVHPTKQEVRFVNSQAIFRVVREAVKKSLSVSPLSQKLDNLGFVRERGLALQDPSEPMQSKEPHSVSLANQPSLEVPLPKVPSYFYRSSFPDVQPEVSSSLSQSCTISVEEPSKVPSSSSPLKIYGTLQDTYILASDGDNLLVIDFHVAHERVLFDRLKREAHAVPQALLVPVRVEFNPREEALYQEYSALIEGVGFRLEPFGSGTYLVRSIPGVISPSAVEEALHQMLQDLAEGGEKASLVEKQNAILESVACKAAVKAGQKLTFPEIERLLIEFFATDQPHTCPHGRPIVIKLPVQELAKRFKRG